MTRNKKGFTLIELLAVIVILAIIALIATPLVLNTIDTAKKGAFQSTAYGLIKSAEQGYYMKQLSDISVKETVYEYDNGVETKNGEIEISYKGQRPKNGVIVINEDGEIGIAIDNGVWCAIKEYSEEEVTLTKLSEKECVLSDVPVNTKNIANKPILSTGMTPIKWNETTEGELTEVPTTEDDSEWYDYDNKKWANAKTKDGSYWVWIPRYAYKITNGYHSNETGTIDVKFLSGTTNTAYDGTTIENSGYEYGVKDTSNNYFQHPAFTFGEEISGFWAAKFEASVYNTSDACYTSSSADNCDKATLSLTIQPNRNSWRNITIGNSFTVSINMKNNSIYGWLSNEIDTHMMKNSEWGAVTYLAQSNYGKVNEVWINNSNTFTTGCAGDSVNAGAYSGCQFAYTTPNGQQASTTGNITGIYDMSGGAFEYVSAYVNTGNKNLTTNGQSIISVHNKYKDIYSVGTSDTIELNYEAAKNKYGDAVYETSSGGNGKLSWNGYYAYMPRTSSPWFIRGGYYYITSTAGLFYFNYYAGTTSSGGSFRVTLHVFE